LKQTNQLWKLYVFMALMAIGAGITLLQGFIGKFVGKEAIAYLAVFGMALVVGAFIWVYNSIICPHCKLKLFWHSIIKVGLGSWFVWLVNLEKCPECGSHDGLPVPGKRPGKSGKRSLH
jgi:hypothetical protein